VAARLLSLLALLLPERDRERFVREVVANMADLRWRQRLEVWLSVAAAVPGLAVILRWAAAAGVRTVWWLLQAAPPPSR